MGRLRGHNKGTLLRGHVYSPKTLLFEGGFDTCDEWGCPTGRVLLKQCLHCSAKNEATNASGRPKKLLDLWAEVEGLKPLRTLATDWR